ncbi:MAG: hypothetical protein ACTH6N_05765 [Brachybacterium tyrofermentans]
MDDWADGLDWQCDLCGSAFNSQWAANECRRECAEADREARRR